MSEWVAEPEVVVSKEVIPHKEIMAHPTYYVPYKWHGVQDGWKCAYPNCDLFETSKDDIILHVLTHYPAEAREKLLDKLMKEKNG